MEKLCGICLYGFISIIIFFPLFTSTGVYRCSYNDNVILRNTLENSDFILILTFRLQFLFFFYCILFKLIFLAVQQFWSYFQPECFDFQISQQGRYSLLDFQRQRTEVQGKGKIYFFTLFSVLSSYP